MIALHLLLLALVDDSKLGSRPGFLRPNNLMMTVGFDPACLTYELFVHVSLAERRPRTQVWCQTDLVA